MFSIDDVDLEFEAGAITAIAELATERKTGARGLRAILEGILQPIMFDIPSNDAVSKVIITEGLVRGEAPPRILGTKKVAAEQSA